LRNTLFKTGSDLYTEDQKPIVNRLSTRRFRINGTINWTSEVDKDNKIRCLDILIITTVYRKESASNQYIHFSSAQAWQQNEAAIRTLKYRAHTYCSIPTLLENEVNHLIKVFLDNGFRTNTFQRILFKEFAAAQSKSVE